MYACMLRMLTDCQQAQWTADQTSGPMLLQGHALYTRQAGSTIPCPYVDYDKGFNAVFARAYGLKDGETISKLFGSDWGELAVMHCSWELASVSQRVPIGILTVVYTPPSVPAILFGTMFNNVFNHDILHCAHVQTHM
jgi:hypothetical protein